MATLTTSSLDPVGWRRVRVEVKAHFASLSGDPQLADRLAGVVWELLTNLRYAGAEEDVTIVVEVELRRIVVRAPGQLFDSVQRAEEPDARGLDTAARRLELALWKWSHRHADGANEICLEDTR